MSIQEFWSQFLSATNKDPSTPYIDCFHFEMSEKWANELLRLVLCGQKQATASSLQSYEISGQRIPQVGDYSVVTDWDGVPHCVIETTKITILPYNQITFEVCKREGEDDCLESWQKGHKKFFMAEGNELGYLFTEDMPVIFEDFKVVYTRASPPLHPL